MEAQKVPEIQEPEKDWRSQHDKCVMYPTTDGPILILPHKISEEQDPNGKPS